MASPNLSLNFFPVSFPELVPFLTRKLEQGETLLAGERRWPSRDGDGTTAVLVDAVVTATSQYNEDPKSVVEAPTGAVYALMSAALGRQLAGRGYDIEDAPVGLSAFSPKHFFTDLPDLSFRRGVEMRPDCLVDRGRRKHFGFFVSVRVRRKFAQHHREDPAQLKSAVGELIRVQSEEHKGKWRLLGFDLERDMAEVASGDLTTTTSLDSIIVPPSYNILVRYGELAGRRGLAGDAMAFERKLGFRYHDNGRSNPAWLAKQRDFITTWLIEAAQFGRVDFSWRAATFSMAIQPIALRET